MSRAAPPAPPAPRAAPLLLLLAAAAAAAAADYTGGSAINLNIPTKLRSGRSIIELGVGCVYEGQWFREGAGVPARDACLRCACGRGALSCRRRACAEPPAPPPRCHLRYRRDACCPELHCPDRVIVLEQEASSRMDDMDIATPASISHACVEGGTVWAAGSALSARAACEACFCLAGERRCVRPRCLPPPPGCRAPPAPGACCPHRYYCDHPDDTTTPSNHNQHDCYINGTWVGEGGRARSAEAPCSRCFCLRGAVRCQPLQCAPALRGCRPLLQGADCCPQQYTCPHTDDETHLPLYTHNGLASEVVEDRAFHLARSSKTETSTKIASTVGDKTKIVTENLITTIKVKRKTNEPNSTVSTPTSDDSVTAAVTQTSTYVPDTTIITTEYPRSLKTTSDSLPTTEKPVETTITDQPDGSVRIMINGTINCTAELSSTAHSANNSLNETEKILAESLPRVPSFTAKNKIEIQTTTPIEIITNRYMSEGLDENESFTINVTSSLFSNKNNSMAAKPNPSEGTNFQDILIANKKTKGDYDFDYAEPTLPPSLPNLKIIPFVAADAVVDDDEPIKQEVAYPTLEREDKYPVYYPSINPAKDTFATRREDVYGPTQYPVFSSDVGASSRYSSAHEIEKTNKENSKINEDLSARLHEYTITASLGNRAPILNKAMTKQPTTSTAFSIETPAVNRFSPPAETEGGFIPKGPGIIDEYYAVYPSTPQAPMVPHLTTSMQLDTKDGECLSKDGRRVAEGATVSIACSVCACVRAELRCSPRPCHTPAACVRRPALAINEDLCCGQLICDNDNNTTTPSTLMVSEPATTSINTTERLSTDISNPTMTSPISKKANESQNIVKTDNSSLLNVTTTVVNSTGKPITVHNTTKKQILNNYTNKTTTRAASSTVTVPTPTTPAVSLPLNESLEYEEDDDDDGGFSFGSVLKLLLSDSYDTTSAAPKKKYETTTLKTRPTPPNWEVYKPPPTTTTKPSPKPSLAPFVPLSSHFSYIPPKKIAPPSVNRIDHLVLGEATAIKKTTIRPFFHHITGKPTPSLQPPTFKPIPAGGSTTQKTYANTRPVEVTSVHSKLPESEVVKDSPRPAGGGGVGGGLLKLAGCNIYGRMYRVGRIIAELSSPCQECRCTELGVQCRALAC